MSGENSVEAYLSRACLSEVHVSLSDTERHCANLLAVVDGSETTTATEIAWEYQVPELGEGGACSLHGKLAKDPFDLASFLGGKTARNEYLLRAASTAVQYYKSHTQTSHWFGVYLKTTSKDDLSVLAKLSYFGNPSRPLFPLTEDFAAISNNSSVGLSGTGRIINNIKEYIKSGNPYYTCDQNVNSEACLPLYNSKGELVGIIDSESFLVDAFADDTECSLLIGVVIAIGEALGI